MGGRLTLQQRRRAALSPPRRPQAVAARFLLQGGGLPPFTDLRLLSGACRLAQPAPSLPSTWPHALAPPPPCPTDGASFQLGRTECCARLRCGSPGGEEGSGGFYVYPTPQAALGAITPSSSRLLHAPRALLRCYVGGVALRQPRSPGCGAGRLCFPLITPVEVLAHGDALLALYRRLLRKRPPFKGGSGGENSAPRSAWTHGGDPQQLLDLRDRERRPRTSESRPRVITESAC